MTELEQASLNVKKKFKNALTNRGMKQVEIAEMLHVSPEQVSRALSGNSTSRDLDIQKRTAKIVGIEL